MEDYIKDFEQAGKIRTKIEKEAKKLITPGRPILEIANTIEQLINAEGAKPGFPTTISCNEYAAHVAPGIEDQKVIGENDIVKFDFGVAVNGAVADQAFTVDLSNENGKLLTACEEALANATSIMKAGVKVNKVGKEIEDSITKHGFNPIRNLGGHMIKPYMLHAGEFIPNYDNNDEYELQEGDIFAIEPFATTGRGQVEDTEDIEIYSIEKLKNVRLRKSKQVLTYLFENYMTLPFARRWLVPEFGRGLLLGAALRELENNGILNLHPALKEVSNGMVAQFEHTVIIEKDSVKILK